MRRLGVMLLALAAVTLNASAQPAKPFDVVYQAMSLYCDPGDPLAMPMKIRSLTQTPYTFWRGSRDLYYGYARAHYQDWMHDTGAYVICHGDLHFGNIGTYAAEPKFGDLAFGMVDFDETARMPFQLELLSGLVTLHFSAQKNHVKLDRPALEKVCQAMLDGYREALLSRRSCTELLADDPGVQRLIALGRAERYEKDELQHWVVGDRFVRVTRFGRSDRAGELKDILRPVQGRRAEFAAAIANAMDNSPRLRDLFRRSARRNLEGDILDIALRTRIDSSGSQGLRKYVILLRRPFSGVNHDIILYLKQEIPAAAERSGLIPRDPRMPAQRCVEDIATLTRPEPLVLSWCVMDAQTYWVYFREPWSRELDYRDFRELAGLEKAARLLGIVAGAGHRQDGAVGRITARLTPDLRRQLVERSEQVITFIEEQHRLFMEDRRTATYSARARRAMDAAESGDK